MDDANRATAPEEMLPAPPGSDAERMARLRLARSRRVGPATFRRLMAEHGTAAAALSALPDVAARAGLEGYAPCPEGVASAELAAGHRAGARLVHLGGPGYPPLLASSADAPPVLWLRGAPGLATRPAVALVGARNASGLGLRMARKLAADLGEAGLVVISGLARGIDAAAHEAALSNGTIAAVAGGVDISYPPENAALMERIATGGLLLAELPPGTQPQARHFPRRNRIVAGLAHAVIVVEGALRSGSLITARCALDQGREVMAVPGHPTDGRAGGCNALIRDGATLVRDAADILAALGPGFEARTRPELPLPGLPSVPEAAGRPARSGSAAPEPGAVAPRILALLGPSPQPEDLLIRDLGLSPAAVAPVLLALEMEGQVQRQPGGLLSRCPT